MTDRATTGLERQAEGAAGTVKSKAEVRKTAQWRCLEPESLVPCLLQEMGHTASKEVHKDIAKGRNQHIVLTAISEPSFRPADPHVTIGDRLSAGMTAIK